MIDQAAAHLHNPPARSLHPTLPCALRELTVQKGWALRHPVAVHGVVS